MGLCFANGIQC